MENTQPTDTAVSSPAAQPTFEIPSDPAANLEWRKTGEIPAGTPKEAKPSKEASTTSMPAVEKSAETEPASATGTKQEKRETGAAAARLDEILADLKKAGLSPAELKTFKREAQAAAAETTAKPSETTAKPQGLEKPVKPKQADFATFEEYEVAKDDYTEKFAEWSAKAAVAADRREQAERTQLQTMKQKMDDAKARYGENTEATIHQATDQIINDKAIAPVVKELLGESKVLIDVMYVLGSKPDDLASFIALAKSDPGAAVRKLVVIEGLVEQELASGKSGAVDKTAEDSAEGSAQRDAEGKFVSQKPPANKKPAAPPPPEELSTRRSAPPDAKDEAIRKNDFARFKEIEDAQDLARRRGA